MAIDKDGQIIKRGDVVTVEFEVQAVHGEAVALKPIDPTGQRHPINSYQSTLAKVVQRGHDERSQRP